MDDITPTLDATALEIERLAKEAQAELDALIEKNGTATAKQVAAIQTRFNAAYVKVLAPAMTTATGNPWDVRMVGDMPVSGMKLSTKLYNSARHTANEVAALIREHAKGLTQARDLAIRLYDGYSPKDGIVRPLEGAARAQLPKALKQLTANPIDRAALQQVYEQGQRYAATLKTEPLKAAYLQALQAWKKGKGDVPLQRALDIAHKEKTRYMANRIAQTELARAHQDAVAREFMADETIEVVQVMMSASHPRVDICNLHARADLFGLGPGCYPKAKAPKPIYHPHCLSGDALITASGTITAVSKRWFDGDVVVITTAAGKRLTATVNHPILTPGGWVGAGFLNVGHDVVCRVAAVDVVAGGILSNDNHQDVPSSIAEIVDSFLRSSEVTTTEVPEAPEHFHGDGVQGNVAVIGAYRELLDGVLPEGLNPVGNSVFSGANRSEVVLPPESSHQFGFEGLFSSANGIVGGARQGGPFFSGHLSHANQIGIPATSNGSPVLFQSGDYTGPADSNALGNTQDGFTSVVTRKNGVDVIGPFSSGGAFGHFLMPPDFDSAHDESPSERIRAYSDLASKINQGFTGDVTLDRVVLIERLEWHDFVYNLETENEHYTSSGIITHNCRCYLRSRPSLTAAMAREKPNSEAAYLRSLPVSEAARVMGSRERLQQVLNGAKLDDVVNATKDPYYKLERLGELDNAGVRSFKQPPQSAGPYDGNAPKVLPDMSTPARVTAVKIENEIRRDTLETGAIIGKDGALLARKQGIADQVQYDVDDLRKMKGATFTHNHPAGLPFSVDDIERAAEFKFSEIRVVTGDFRFSASGVDTVWAGAVKLAYDDSVAALTDAINALVRADQLNMLNYHAELQHRAWIETAKLLGFKYWRERS